MIKLDDVCYSDCRFVCGLLNLVEFRAKPTVGDRRVEAVVSAAAFWTETTTCEAQSKPESIACSAHPHSAPPYDTHAAQKAAASI